jgi:hypothetical protein
MAWGHVQRIHQGRAGVLRQGDVTWHEAKFNFVNILGKAFTKINDETLHMIKFDK